jgi:hypothetical protein
LAITCRGFFIITHHCFPNEHWCTKLRNIYITFAKQAIKLSMSYILFPILTAQKA